MEMNTAAGAGAAAWSSGLYDCSDDCGLCCLTCWCPCITFGRLAAIVDRGSTSSRTAGAQYGLLLGLMGCEWIYSCALRTKMRAQYGLPEEPCSDCCVHFCCDPCALVQEYKELRSRCYFPVLGHGSAPGVQMMDR